MGIELRITCYELSGLRVSCLVAAHDAALATRLRAGLCLQHKAYNRSAASILGGGACNFILTVARD
ncbi:hypothetical protein [Pontibacter akesuensis]|uniref:hypothetical protein n=1 Tax=Pontibacter akesuensis TaxID=388950 RepID=UPI000AAEFA25|nr:hypothetical protein [Pontibacter akesuensis]